MLWDSGRLGQVKDPSVQILQDYASCFLGRHSGHYVMAESGERVLVQWLFRFRLLLFSSATSCHRKVVLPQRYFPSYPEAMCFTSKEASNPGQWQTHGIRNRVIQQFSSLRQVISSLRKNLLLQSIVSIDAVHGSNVFTSSWFAHSLTSYRG